MGSMDLRRRGQTALICRNCHIFSFFDWFVNREKRREEKKNNKTTTKLHTLTSKPVVLEFLESTNFLNFNGGECHYGC